MAKWADVKGRMKEVEEMAASGLFDYQIAQNLGVCVDTFIEWKKVHIEFSEAIKRGRHSADEVVENKLFQRATGYDFTEVTEELVYDEVTRTKELKVIKQVTKHIAADVGAIAFWLKNRMPDVWKDRHELDHGGQVNVSGNPFAGLTEAELRRLANNEGKGKDNG